MDRHEAARELGVAYADVLSVEASEHGTVVEVRDGGRRLIADDGHYALDDHPGTAQLRRWEPPADEPEPESAEEKPAPKPKTSRARKAAT